MKKLLVILSMLVCTTAYAEFVTDLSTGWRLTVGPQFNFSASGRLGIKGRTMPVPTSSFSSTRAAAKAAGDSLSKGSWRLTFPNGAFVDPNDAAGVDGQTWNWRIPAGQLNGGVMSFANGYVEQSTVYDVMSGSDKDSNWSAGVNFGVERTVWRHGSFGVDVGFNFAFFLKNDWFKGNAGGYRRTDTRTEGRYMTEVDMGNAAVMNDPWTRNADGSYGGGSYGGPGPVISMDEISVGHSWAGEASHAETSVGSPFSICGDLQQYEFQISLRPYWELTDWFMVRGTLGVGLDYRRFEVGVRGFGSETAADWDCYMIGGLGGMFHWDDICLGVDFLRKVFDDELDVNTRYVSGSIRNANWMCRAYVGYEF